VHAALMYTAVASNNIKMHERGHGSSSDSVCARQDELFAGLKCQPGFVCSRPELSEDLRTLLSCVRCRLAGCLCALQCLNTAKC